MIDTPVPVSYNTPKPTTHLSQAEIEFWLAYLELRERVLKTELNWVERKRAEMQKQQAVAS